MKTARLNTLVVFSGFLLAALFVPATVRSADAPRSKTAPKSVVPAPSPDLQPENADLARFKGQLNEYRLLVWKLGQAAQRKAQLEQELEKAKSARGGRQLVDEFVRQREVENLQAQLHLTIDESNQLAKQKLKFLGEISDKAPAYRASFQRMLDARDQSLGRKNLNKEVGARIQVEQTELKQYIAMLDEMTADSRKAEAVLNRSLDSPVPSGPAPETGDGKAQPGQPPRLSVWAMIRRIEREQESLLKRWQQNEASLRRLRSMLRAPGSSDEAAEPGDEPSAAANAGLLQARSQGDTSAPPGPFIPSPLLRAEVFAAGGSDSAPAESPSAPRP
ncbi:MAG: hypothetical protein NTW86_05025 [Candidatus Sumerlaeota bacterium]|nr:hypothetical protein [Candidatus Sumerlaeota bacterium]